MEADIVPICRIRRNTSWWTYRLSPINKCAPGSLVVISFRGRKTLGVVWNLHAQTERHDLEHVQQVLTPEPIVRQPQRQLIEWLADTGTCSLSTALWQWCPRALRKTAPSAYLLGKLAGYNTWAERIQPQPPRQKAFLLPSYRPETVEALSRDFQARPSFSDSSEKEELDTWFSIAQGACPAVVGRERALYAPWLNLHEIHLFDPEDISYYHEQTPYLSLVDACLHLGRTSRCQSAVHTRLPQRIASELWSAHTVSPNAPARACEYLNSGKEGLLGQELVSRIQAVVDQRKQVLILYNAKDRLSAPASSGERTVIPGVQTIRSRLARALGVPELPPNIHLDTRSLFQRAYKDVALCVVLSLDPLIIETLFANKLHGWSDLMRLFIYDCPIIIQSRDGNHPLVTSLINARFSEYMREETLRQKSHRLPPFANYTVCSLPLTDGKEAAQSVYTKLAPHVAEPWKISLPFLNTWRKKDYVSLFLYSSEEARLPSKVRDIVCALPKPWKIQRNPWHLF